MQYLHDEAACKLSADGKSYEGEESATPTKPGGIGLPYNIGFWAEAGQEATLLKVASAYEAATHHRRPPPAFGPVKSGARFPHPDGDDDDLALLSARGLRALCSGCSIDVRPDVIRKSRVMF